MIDRSKFLEPTEKYLERNTVVGDKSPDVAKDWFNIDLIFFAVQYKNTDYHQAVGIQMAFEKFKEYYDLDLTMAEVDKLFGDYPKECFDELMIEVIQGKKIK
jgi:hypothetical protein